MINFQPARMGQFIPTHRREPMNPNAMIHAMLTPARPMQRVVESAAITKGKEFPDVSYYQGLMDWDKFRLMNDAVIIRAGQRLYEDAQFARNWSEARARGLIRGSYWFYDDRADPLQQAQLWINLLGNDRPEMECWVDWETFYGGTFGGLANVVKLLKAMQAAGFKVGLYTGYYFFINNSNPVTHAKEYDYLKALPLWLAWYTLDPSIVLVPNPWNMIWLWQYGTPAVGAQHGAATSVIDMNWFNGTADSFYYYYGQALPQPPEGGTMTQYIVTGAQGLNLRNLPTTSSNVLRLIPTNSFVWGVKDPLTGWITGTKYQEPGKPEVAMNFYCSGTLVKEYVPPAPPPTQPSVFVSHTFQDTLTVNGVTYTATFTVPNVEYKPQP